MNLKVKDPKDAQYHAWIGASIVGSLTTQNHIITRAEYNEEGLSVLARKKLKM